MRGNANRVARRVKVASRQCATTPRSNKRRPREVHRSKERLTLVVAVWRCFSMLSKLSQQVASIYLLRVLREGIQSLRRGQQQVNNAMNSFSLTRLKGRGLAVNSYKRSPLKTSQSKDSNTAADNEVVVKLAIEACQLLASAFGSNMLLLLVI